MKQLLIYTLSITLILLNTSFGQNKLKALIIDGQNNHKNWPSTTRMMKGFLEDTRLFEVEVATTAPEGESVDNFRPNFSDYDVIVSNYNGAMWPEETRRDFETYMSNGGGFVSVHAADNAFTEWEAYNQMIGLGGWYGRDENSGPYVYMDESGEIVRDDSPGKGGHHGMQHEFVITHQVTDHPITKGLPKQWLHARDELYDMLRGPAENMTILATAYSAPEFGGTGRDEPMLMVLEYGEGRIFHTVLGHGDYSMNDVGFITTLQRGTEWAATGYVTQAVPKNFPSIEKVSIPEGGEKEWVSIFDGKTLKGWQHINGYAKYWVEDAAVVGQTVSGSPNSFLCSEKTYGDFELELEVKVDQELNAGIQIRSMSTPEYRNGRVHGYQVEVDAENYAGYVYDEGRRGWLSENRDLEKSNEAFKDGQWNRYRIRCKGDKIQSWINGKPLAYVVDDMTKEGFIGLQVHGVGKRKEPLQVRYRRIAIREL